jgi:TonB family protein
MSTGFQQVGGPPRDSDRRLYSRQPVMSLAYIELGEGNGGIVLNVSEGGLAVQAVMSLLDDDLPQLRFQFSQSKNWITTGGRIAWTSESKKMAGVEFVDLPEEARNHIKEWISSAGPPSVFPEEENTRFEKTEQALSAPTPNESPAPIPVTEPETASLVVENQGPDSSGSGEPAGDPTRAADTSLFLLPGDQAEVPTASAASLRAALLPEQTSVHAGERSRRWLLAVLVGFLAAASLAAGWMTRQGAANEMFKKVNSMISGKSAPGGVTAGDNSAPVVSPEGERAASDSGNQRVPLRPAQPSNRDNVLPAQGSDEPHGAGGPTPPEPSQETPQGGGALQSGQPIYRVEPFYPPSAIADHIEGTVTLRAVIDRDGTVSSLKTISGPPVLVTAAENVVRQWRYEPTLRSGQPIETEQEVVIEFRLSPSTGSGRAPAAARSEPEGETAAAVPAQDGVVRQVLPDVPQKARDTIRGTIGVSARIGVDPSGSVARATLDSPGPSKYFADLALEAARQWKFAPAKIDGQGVSSEWTLRFEFSAAGVKVRPMRTAP